MCCSDVLPFPPIFSLGLEVNVAVLHNFQKERELLATLSLEMPRSQRAKIINKVIIFWWF